MHFIIQEFAINVQIILNIVKNAIMEMNFMIFQIYNSLEKLQMKLKYYSKIIKWDVENVTT